MFIRNNRFTSERQRSSTNLPTTIPPKERKKLSISVLIATGVASLTIISVVFSLIGYGVALSVEAEFGLPHTALFSSAFDLIELSTWSVMRIMTALGNSIYASQLYCELFKQGLWILGIGACITIAAALIEWHPKARNWVQLMSERKRSILKKSKINKTNRILFWGFLSSAGAAVLVPLTTILLLATAVLMLAWLALIPLTSMSAAQSHIKEYVITPTQCAKLNTLDERLQKSAAANSKTTEKPKPVAACVALRNGDGKVVADGRVVFSTSHAIVLFDPVSGSADCFPLQGLFITAVDKLLSEKNNQKQPG